MATSMSARQWWPPRSILPSPRIDLPPLHCRIYYIDLLFESTSAGTNHQCHLDHSTCVHTSLHASHSYGPWFIRGRGWEDKRHTNGGDIFFMRASLCKHNTSEFSQPSLRFGAVCVRVGTADTRQAFKGGALLLPHRTRLLDKHIRLPVTGVLFRPYVLLWSKSTHKI